MKLGELIVRVTALLPVLLLAFLCFAGGVAAQNLYSPLKIVVPAAPGGATDRAARIIADALKDKLGVAVIVENNGAAGGLVAAQRVKSAPPTENVLLMGNPTTNVLAPIIFKSPGYDPQGDFVPVSAVRTYLYAVAVGPESPVSNVKQLVAWLRDNPGQANFGVPALGSLPHLFALLLSDAAQVKPQMIGYRGSALLLADLVGGQLPVAVDVVDGLVQQHHARKITVLAVSGSARWPSLPEVPTLKESGIEAVGDGWSVFFAPTGMPGERVRLLSRAIQEVMASPEIQNRFRAANLEPVVSSVEQTERMLATYRAKWEPIARAAKVRE